jgi:hypothetical protein
VTPNLGGRFPRETGPPFLFHSPLPENRHMRLVLIAIMFFSLGVDATSAQTIPGTPPASPASFTNADVLPPLRLLPRTTPAVGISPHRQSLPQSRQKEHDSAVADCMRMWDSETHMTQQEWGRTCKRVQTRLDNLNVDALMPETSKRGP